MISGRVKDLLKRNWGEKAEAMACYAEAKLMHPRRAVAWYLFAMNPEDEDEICAIVANPFPSAYRGSLSEILEAYQGVAEDLQLDQEFRRIRADVLYKKLQEGR